VNLSLTFDGHRVRMAGTPEHPLWIAKDVCYVLGLHGSSHIARDIPDAEKGVAQLATPGGPQPYVCVREAGLYRLIARSRKPAAQRFQAWLFGEVLPCIRQHGCYPAPPAKVALSLNVDLRDPKMLASLALQLTEIVREKDERIAELAPKADVYDEVMSADGTFTVAQAAQLLCRLPHRPMGEKRLFAFMREHGIFKADNTPYQEHVEGPRPRFVVLDKSWKDSDGQRHSYYQTRVTQAGVEYLLRRLDKAESQKSLIPMQMPAEVH
jgi:anti-repressor protein